MFFGVVTPFLPAAFTRNFRYCSGLDSLKRFVKVADLNLPQELIDYDSKQKSAGPFASLMQGSSRSGPSDGAKTASPQQEDDPPPKAPAKEEKASTTEEEAATKEKEKAPKAERIPKGVPREPDRTQVKRSEAEIGATGAAIDDTAL